MDRFRLRVRLDPGHDQRAQLLAYPDDDLFPDFAVVTSGVLAIDLGAHAVAYRNGRLIARPAGGQAASVWLPDYVGGTMLALADAVLYLEANQPTSAHLLDGPAALTFVPDTESVTIRFHDRDTVAYKIVVSRVSLRAAVAAAIATFLDDLLALNPRLARHPDVIGLQERLAALVAPLPTQTAP